MSHGRLARWRSRAHSPSFQPLYLRHISFWFSKLSVTSPTSQLILQPFPGFTNVTTHSPTFPLLHLRHSSFSNPSFASPTSQDFHLRPLVSRPCGELLDDVPLMLATHHWLHWIVHRHRHYEGYVTRSIRLLLNNWISYANRVGGGRSNGTCIIIKEIK